MRYLRQRLLNVRTGAEVAHTVYAADTFLTRLRGLIGHPPLGDGCALWIAPCNQIHTHFLRHAIDAVFIAADGQVLQIHQGVEPWRILPRVAGARAVVEFCGLRVSRLEVGDVLRLIQP